MAHEVESMFYVNETPWHGLGYRFETPPPTVDEAMKMAGLDWQVSLQPVYRKRAFNASTNQDVFEEIPESRCTVRSTDNALLGVVGDRFKPLQNVDAFKTFQPFLDSGEAAFETAGSLRGGRRVWILAKLNRPNAVIVPGDEVRKYLLLSHGHDGSMSINYGLTPIRVVCANTLSAAQTNKSSQLLKLRHTANAGIALEAVSEIVNAADAIFEATAEQYRALAARGISKKSLDAYVRVMFDVSEFTPVKDISTRKQNQMAKVVHLFEHGKGNNLPGVKGTAWAAYNAMTEYMSHSAGHNAESRLNGLWFGPGQGENAKALEEALKMAA